MCCKSTPPIYMSMPLKPPPPPMWVCRNHNATYRGKCVVMITPHTGEAAVPVHLCDLPAVPQVATSHRRLVEGVGQVQHSIVVRRHVVVGLKWQTQGSVAGNVISHAAVVKLIIMCVCFLCETLGRKGKHKGVGLEIFLMLPWKICSWCVFSLLVQAFVKNWTGNKTLMLQTKPRYFKTSL